ncbi:hypothetical protein AB0H18_11965 [Streptomyces sp. NPDC020766]|uniref:hypothetical protein n=1 Tax=Streptomyces sp. NPDC020766 TaxID=3155011 RepID=UPI0033F07278
MSSDGADEVDDRVGDDARGLMIRSRAVCQTVLKLAWSGSVPYWVLVASAMAVRGPQQLADDQQGVDLLVDAVGGAGPQDPAAEDGQLHFQAGRFGLPALVIQRGQCGCRVAGVVEQGGRVSRRW